MIARQLSVGVLVASLVALPWMPGSMAMTVGTFAAIAGIAALGFNITFGLCGQLSMFHAAAFGLGGYGTVLAMRHFGLDFGPALLLTVIAVAVLAAAVGFVCFRFRLRDFYFAVTTMAVSEIIRLGVLNWHSVTNGSLGMTVSERASVAGFALNSPVGWYLSSLAALVLAYAAYEAISRSWLGRSLSAIRIDDGLAEALGIDSLRYKMLGFVLGSGYACVAGALYVFYLGFADPALLSVELMLSFVAMVLLGGTGSALGAVLGAAVLTALPHFIHMGAELRAMTYGAILISAILLLPQGLVRLIGRGERGHA